MCPSKQRGATLFISLVLLAVLTMLGTATVKSGLVETKVASNTNQMVDGFHKAESGANAALSLARSSSTNPFNGPVNNAPFAGLSASSNPLANISNVNVAITRTNSMRDCSRRQAPSSNMLIKCEFYEINSTHAQANNGNRVVIREGVSRDVIAN